MSMWYYMLETFYVFLFFKVCVCSAGRTSGRKSKRTRGRERSDYVLAPVQLYTQLLCCQQLVKNQAMVVTNCNNQEYISSQE